MSSKKTAGSGKHGLGRGLSVFLPQREDSREGDTIQQIKIANIQVSSHQPRRTFPLEGLQKLSESLKAYGLVQPIIVQKQPDGGFVLVAGERRLRAAKLCGWEWIPACVRTYEEQLAAEVTLIENIQREDLTAVEEGMAYQRFIEEFSLTQEQVAAKVGKSRSHIANMMRLLQLPESIQAMIDQGQLSMGQARPLLSLSERAQQEKLAALIVAQELSARQAERLVKDANLGKDKRKKMPQDTFLKEVQDQLKVHLGTSVAIRLDQHKQKGKIEISFASEAEFERLLALLTDLDNRDDRKETISFHV